MDYSLVTILEVNEDSIKYIWTQDITSATLGQAKQRLIGTSKANSNRLNFAIIPKINSVCHDYNIRTTEKTNIIYSNLKKSL